jgi:hypothetical protein
MPSLDQLLYRWICRANERREDLDLPAGLIEDSIGVLKRVLGTEYLEQLLIEDVEAVHFLDDQLNPLRKWLLSPAVDYSIIQVFRSRPILQGLTRRPLTRRQGSKAKTR